MPRLFELRDNVTGRKLVRHALDAKEILGQDPERYSLTDPAVKLKPRVHEDRIRLSEDEEADLHKRYPHGKRPVAVAAPRAAAATPPSAPSTKPPQAKQKREMSPERKAQLAANLAKGRATREHRKEVERLAERGDAAA